MSKEIERIYSDVMEFIATATATCNDEQPTMESLTTDVGLLTQAINAVPLPERLAHKDKLDALATALRGLEAQLQMRKSAIVAELEGQPVQAKAHKAYAKTDTLKDTK